jgi:hypothetical protein
MRARIQELESRLRQKSTTPLPTRHSQSGDPRFSRASFESHNSADGFRDRTPTSAARAERTCEERAFCFC